MGGSKVQGILAVLTPVIALLPGQISRAGGPPPGRPSVILCMADDMGWGDAGYNGHPRLKTPYLDRMAAGGLQFNRFYAAAPVCSPTRGSCLTGRHPYRYGIPYANRGHMKSAEVTLAEVLRRLGYRTGHFGKWHLGTLTRNLKDGRRGGRQNEHYSPPWENGFEVCFSTEQAVPTWDPVRDQPIETRYWTGPGEYAKENLDGDDSRVIMDRVLPFIRGATEERRPFLAVIWFHTPHSPVIAGPGYRAMYANEDEDHQHYYGCLTAMDEQIGRLRAELSSLGVEGDTMLWFTSDNGPAARGGGPGTSAGGRQRGTAGPFRGRKGSLLEGGVRVPGLLVWPSRISGHRETDVPCVTSDCFPTILAALGHAIPEQETRPYDGVSLLPLIQGKSFERPRPIAFQSGQQLALSGERHKIYSSNRGKTWALYDLAKDPAETANLADERPELVKSLATTFQRWQASCLASAGGEDYR